MYEVLNTFKWKPNPKFQWNLINIEKPQKFSKTPNPRFQNMKCMNEKGLEVYQVKKNLKNLVKSLRTKIGVFLGEKQRSIEREIDGNEKQIVQRLYIGKLVNLNRCRYREVSSDLSRKYSSTAEVSRRYRGSTHQNQEQKFDRSTRYWEAIEHTDPISIDPSGIEV